MKSIIKKVLFAVPLIAAGMCFSVFYYSVANDSGMSLPTPYPQTHEGLEEIPKDSADLYISRYNPEGDKTLRGVNISNDALQKILEDGRGGLARIYFQLAEVSSGTNVIYIAAPKNTTEKAKYYLSTDVVAPICPIVCPNN